MTMVYLLVFLLSFAWSAAPQAQVRSEPAALGLNRAHRLDSPALVPPAELLPDAATLPDRWRGMHADVPHQRWYQFRFDQGGWSFPAIYIERACTNVEVWVNGERVGSGGSMVEPVTQTCYFAQLFRFPASLLKPGDNRLDVRVVGYPAEWVASRQRAGGLSPLWVGEQSELQPRFALRNFWNIDLARVIGIAMGLLGLAIAALGWFRKQDRHPFYFGLALTLWALMGTRLYVQDMPFGWRTAEIVFTSLYPPFAYAFIQFLLHFVRRPQRRVRQVLLLQCGLVPLALLLEPANAMSQAALTLYVLLTTEFLAAFAFFAWHSWRGRRRDFWVMGGILLVLLVLTVLEVAIQTEWINLPKVHLLHLAMPALALVMGVRLVQEFAGALAETERLNRELEQRVADKSAEIEQTYRQLSALKVEQAALAERQRIASDLHDDLGAQLVTIAQASLVANDVSRVSDLARKALADMRLAVRGLTGEEQPVAYVLADWRRETVERLQVAGIATFWNASESAMEWVLSSRLQVQLTRVLREAISNVIHHSGAKHCWVDIHVTQDALRLGIEDDGRGFDVLHIVAGQGLRNLETRTHSLGGSLHVAARDEGGTCIRAVVPLTGNASAPCPHDGGTA
ncbi:MAG: histidine kinase [Rhodoferax sp.]|nr:histidine kinase [Rhodoferax sp.]